MDSNWYVLRTEFGKEEDVIQLCCMLIRSEVKYKMFIPKYEKMIKSKGIWRKEIKPLFTGYVFIETDMIEELSVELAKIPTLTLLLGKHQQVIYSVYQYEKEYFEQLFEDNYVVSLSTGLLENDVVTVLSGPLIGMEAVITHINRHKRLAEITTTLLGNEITTTVGLEVLNKL